NDPKAVEEALHAFHAQHEVQAAGIYSTSGKLFAGYIRPGFAHSLLPSSASGNGAVFSGDRLQVTRTIVAGNNRVGTLFIQSGMQDWYVRRNQFTGMVACLVLLCTAIALLIGAGMQKMISAPILNLARTMREIAAKQLFDTRVHKRGD